MPNKFIYGGYVAWKKDEWRDIIGHELVEDAECTVEPHKGTDNFCPTHVIIHPNTISFFSLINLKISLKINQF